MSEGKDVSPMDNEQQVKIVDRIYRSNYYMGARLIISANRVKRRVRKITSSAISAISKWLAIKKQNVNHTVKPILFKYKLNLTLIKREFSLLKQVSPWRMPWHVLGILWSKKLSIFNHLAPIMAVAMLFYSVNYYTDRTWALSVEYAGQIIGYVETESDYYEAKKLVTERIINEEYKEPDSANVTFTMQSIKTETISDSFELSDQIIRASENDIAEASGLYVDNKFLGAVTDHNMLLKTMDEMLEPYEEMHPDAKIGFANNIELIEGLYPVSSIVDYTQVADVITSEAMGESTYVVVSGDSPWAIASKTSTPLSQLLSLNPTIETRLIPGDEIVVEAAQPYLDIKVATVETYVEQIPYETTNVNDSSMIRGQTSISTSGIPGEQEIVAEVTYLNGNPIETNIISTVVLSEPVTQVVKVGTNTLNSISSTGSVFVWPTSGTITVGWYGYPGHTAIDIASGYGTPIYAASSGTVSKVVNGYTGYGRYLMIDHGGGAQTLYAHNNSIIVSPGEYVHQGQIIAYMGSSGNSSGPHCHFEVRINGTFVNPMNYLP